ncbi:MAG: hypothetical protein WCV91_06190, partial [Candidatus Margulisiibacteriota bacterium]
DAIKGVSRLVLRDSFLGGLEKITRRAADDLSAVESGRLACMPGIEGKIRSTFNVIGSYNGQVVMRQYLDAAEQNHARYA